MEEIHMHNNSTKIYENTELVNMNTESVLSKEKKNEELRSIYSCEQCDFSTTELTFFKKHIHKKILLENQEMLNSTVNFDKIMYFLNKFSA